jgi:hypothetical protein
VRKLLLFSFTVFVFGCGDNMPVEPEVDLSPELAVAQADGGMGVMASVAGNGHFAPFDDDINSFMFNAKEKADGTVKGQATMQIRVHGTFWKLDIDCLAVNGNQAVVSGVVTETNTPYVGVGGWFAMEDNGEGGNAEPDRITGFWGILPYFLPTPGYCHEAIQDIDAYLEPYTFGWKDVIRGNVQVNGADVF